MKSKQLFWSLIAIIILNTSCGQAQETSSNEEVSKMLKSFYTSYISENAKMPADNEKLYSLKKKYCTSSLINKIESEEMDYDPFLNAQDTDIEWLKTLVVSKDTKQENTYTVSYIDKYDNKKNSIKLKVIKQDGSFKIDAIL